MYGTLYRLRAGMSQEQDVVDQLFHWEQEVSPGYILVLAQVMVLPLPH